MFFWRFKKFLHSTIGSEKKTEKNCSFSASARPSQPKRLLRRSRQPIYEAKPHTFYILNSRRGFTIIELLIFTAIFSIMSVAFLSALVSAIQIQVKQLATSEVNQQSQFLLDTIQYYVQSASLVELPSDTATTTLKLRTSSSSTDPLYIYLSGDVVYLKQTDSGAAEALTSSKVAVSNLTFTKRANNPGHDSVNVLFTIAYNAVSQTNSFFQNLQ